MTTRVFLADDHTMVREGLRSILEHEADIQVVGEAGDGWTAVEQITALHPHVVIMDIALPVLNGVEATRQVLRHHDDVAVLMLSMYDDEVRVRQSLKAGARGYLLKDAEALDLVRAVRAVAAGESYFSPAVSKRLLGGYLAGGADNVPDDDVALLTERERQVLQLVAEGHSNKEIAARLSISVSTAESHRKHLMEKLDLHNTAAMVRFAVRKGIIDCSAKA
jgi:DNA-binding NarL/FixJ family response regulator